MSNMFWRPPPVRPLPIDEDALRKAATSLAQSLNEYEKLFYQKAASAFDESAEQARVVVAEARAFIESSRLGCALSRSLLEHVKHWPSWSRQDNFADYCKPPFRFCSGANGSETGSNITVVEFSYDETPFGLRFIEEGMAAWNPDDTNLYGKAEFISDDKTVLGIDICYDLSKGDAAFWSMTDAYAFLPGPWMKVLIEMAARIDASHEGEMQKVFNQDRLMRAKSIQLADRIAV